MPSINCRRVDTGGRRSYRANLTMRQLAPLFGVSPATVCRVIQRLGPLLAHPGP